MPSRARPFPEVRRDRTNVRSLPFSPAAERNRIPIGDALQPHLVRGARVLEFGAGAGQHACHVAAARPDVSWLATDRAEALPGLSACIQAAALANLETPVALDLLDPATQQFIVPGSRDLCFAANVLHIAPVDAVAALFGIAAHALGERGALCLYGPVTLDGRYTSDGNEAFDRALREQDERRGVRDTVDLDRWARATGFGPAALEPLPSGNHLMVWQRGFPAA